MRVDHNGGTIVRTKVMPILHFQFVHAIIDLEGSSASRRGQMIDRIDWKARLDAILFS